MLKEYNNEMVKSSAVNSCLLCLESELTSYYRLSCSHVMSMCDTCQTKLQKKCPVCRTRINIFEKVYIVG